MMPVEWDCGNDWAELTVAGHHETITGLLRDDDVMWSERNHIERYPTADAAKLAVEKRLGIVRTGWTPCPRPARKPRAR